MGEIFERPNPATAFPWTGERLTSGVAGQVEIEHLHRYVFARQLCRDLDVLDIASGEGYGSALLAQVARSVIGVEINQLAVEHASKAYQLRNLRFLQGDARAIPLADASVDAVVSFETIEHFYEHALFMAEIRRVLRPGGLLIISSPERDAYSPPQRAPNPFHLRELTRDEFVAALKESFEHVSVYGQRPFMGAALVLEGETVSGPILTFERRGDAHFEASSGLSRPIYLVAIASNRSITAPAGALYIEKSDIESIYTNLHAADLLKSQAEDWRLGFIERGDKLAASDAALESVRQRLKAKEEEFTSLAFVDEARTRDLKRLHNEANGYQADLEASSIALQDLESHSCNLRASFDALRSTYDALKIDCDLTQTDRAALVADRLKLHTELKRLSEECDALTRRAENAESHLSTLLKSTSWRVTLPLRKLRSFLKFNYIRSKRAEQRTPACLEPAQNMAIVDDVESPQSIPSAVTTEMQTVSEDLVDTVSTLAAVPQELALVESMVLNNTLRQIDFPGHTHLNNYGHASLSGLIDGSLINSDAQTRIWFFLGDTIEWLKGFRNLSGVGRVTTELFFAATHSNAPSIVPCAPIRDFEGLASLSIGDSLAFIADRIGISDSVILRGEPGRATRPPVVAPELVHGDHIIFTGLIWTSAYEKLFRNLAAAEVRFSVLVYDIIPLQSPHFVTEAHRLGFESWLKLALNLAHTIFVSSDKNRDELVQWAALAKVPIAGRVVPIVFGGVPLRLRSTAGSAGLALNCPLAIEARFVLSVGTIDLRKNQSSLCRVWSDLRNIVAEKDFPQLVLVGRDDLGLESLSEDVAMLIKSGKIAILQDVHDAQLATLYEKCLFTCFPSLAEGYGLPVAESLAFGKVCIASDLAVIRDHAGALPWYVSPGDDSALLKSVLRAIREPNSVTAAEAEIRRGYSQGEWSETWATIQREVDRATLEPGFVPGKRSDIAELPPIRVTEALRRAGLWCTNDRPDVSIIIVNWNAADLTLECIRRLWANSENVKYEVIIVDNGSDERSLVQLDQLGVGVSLLRLNVNRYFGEANNIAVEVAKGPFILLLNNDAFLQEGCLEILFSAIQNGGKPGAVGPLFLFPNGRVQEAGGYIDSTGFPVRASRDEELGSQKLTVTEVDYISAAALLVRRDAFLLVGGFDLMFEPAYYEDVDLCFKLRGIGHPVIFCPSAQVVHIEGAATSSNPEDVLNRRSLGDLNRDKFTSRWSAFLDSRSQEALLRVTAEVVVPHRQCSVSSNVQTAALFTPYALTPGGGERFLLSIASELSKDFDTIIVTPQAYSQSRLRTLERDLELDLGQCRLVSLDNFLAGDNPDLMVTLGNHIVPPIGARGKNSFFICQFPFPMSNHNQEVQRHEMGCYDKILSYSEFARAHIIAAQSAYQMPACPVAITYPPVPQHGGNANHKQRTILTVGRFFVTGHTKRHDLIISAFRQLLDRTGDASLRLYVVGSSLPYPEHMAYLAGLRRQAEGLPVFFAVNASAQHLKELYRSAMFYWHAAGLEMALETRPYAAEHFGITVAEAMSAECVPMAFNAGGPREYITSGVDGVLYDSLDQLVEKTAELLVFGADARRIEMGRAAARRVRMFSPERFRERIRAEMFAREA